MGNNFAHLHLHTEYSVLDGAIRVADLPAHCLAIGQQAVACTDHGYLFGAVDFYRTAKAHGVQPILGMETYVCADHKDRQHRRQYHLVLLATNDQGYRNLRALASIAATTGFYYYPRIDLALLRQYSAGLVGLSACLGGEVAATYLTKGYAGAHAVAAAYCAALGGPQNFYLEAMTNKLPDQEAVNANNLKLAEALGCGLVATADCHYLRASDTEAHEALLAVQTNKDLADETRLTHGGKGGYYVRSAAEMEASLTSSHGGNFTARAMEGTAAVAARCAGGVTLQLGKTTTPRWQCSPGETEDETLHRLANAGLAVRLAQATARGQQPDSTAYQARLAMELRTITSMGFAGYFLRVADFCGWAHKQGIPVGPGRGSGAGSLAAYALRITALDPIPHGLYFERFLNTERVSMPDFDIDFCQRRRDEVYGYLVQRYGRARVARITTFMTLSAKSAIASVGKAMGMEYPAVQALTVDLPDTVEGHPPTMAWALANGPKLRTAVAAATPQVLRLVKLATGLQGLTKATSQHAAGVVVADSDLWDAGVPVMRTKDGDDQTTQHSMDDVESLGLIKYDLLGLKTLTVLALAVAEVAKYTPGFDLEALPLDDAPTYAMVAAGDTWGVFQMGEDGLRTLLRRLKPDRFEDIVAAIALYRPGPLEGGMVDSYVECKHGRKPVASIHPALDAILAETYGVLVYQEQVMAAVQAIAGYTLGQADVLRRIVGKKKREEVAAEHERFMVRAAAAGVCDAATATRVWELIAVFAGYGFNKSHSAGYALLGYWTAYLRKHHPEAWAAALTSCEAEGDPERMRRAVADLRGQGLPCLPPCAVRSGADCTVEALQGGGKAVRLGLRAIVGVGDTVLAKLLAGRPYATATAVGARVNKKVAEALANAGALDHFAGGNRAAALAAALAGVGTGAQAAQAAQGSLFAMLGGTQAAHPTPNATQGPAGAFAHTPAWAPAERLRREREALGFYLSGHPARAWRPAAIVRGCLTCHGAAARPDRSMVRLMAVVVDVEERAVKSSPGKHTIRLAFEDEEGSLPGIVFSNNYEALKGRFAKGMLVVVEGTMSREAGGEPKVMVRTVAGAMVILAPFYQGYASPTIHPNGITVVVPLWPPTEEGARNMLQAIAGALRAHPGPQAVQLHVPEGAVRGTLHGYKVMPSYMLAEAVAAAGGVLVLPPQGGAMAR